LREPRLPLLVVEWHWRPLPYTRDHDSKLT